MTIEPLDMLRLVVIVLGAISIYAALRLRRASRNAPGGHSGVGADAAGRSAAELLTEIEKAAREMNVTLDRRTRELERLIREADERIALMDESPASPCGVGAPVTAGTASTVASPPPRSPDAAARVLAVRYAAIYRLADAGSDVAAIARESGMPRGEVELILGLRGTGKP
ncbi:MAG: hypothetical protein V1809_14900 [Planctomycetota bacterium]